MKGSQLEELPSEILTRIADSLEAKFVLRTFPLVSKRLNAVFTDEKIWQNRLNAKFPGRKLFPRWQRESYLSEVIG